MIKIDLITGFLGSGKTTFIRKYSEYLEKNNNKICILENDFGAVNVDMLLLQDIMNENCDLEMISGACDKDCHKRRFKTKLISMAMRGFDRVIIEPSGIYDVDEFFDVLREDPVDKWYEIGNVIAIVNSCLEENLSKESEYLLASQIANAGKVVLSRCQEADEKTIKNTLTRLNKIMDEFHCVNDSQKDVLCKNWNNLTDDDFKNISECGYSLGNYEKLWFDQNKAFTSQYFMNIRMTEEQLREKVNILMNDRSCGNIFRIKGFMLVGDNKWIEVNATHKNISIEPIERGQEVFIVIGENLNKDRIKEIIE